MNQQIAVKQSVMQAVPFNSNVDNLLKRVVLFLENGEWESASDYCNKALDQNSECAMAYLYLFMSEMKLKREEELDFWIYAKHCKNNRNLNLAFRFADYTLKKKFENYNMCFERNKNQVITTLTQYFEQRLKKNRRGGLERYLNFAKGQIAAIENTILKTESSIESVNINELQQQFENTNSKKNITISEYSTIHGRITSLESELSKMTILKKKKKEQLLTEITGLKKQKSELFVKSQELKATTMKLQKSIENCISEKIHIEQLKEKKDKLVNEINDIQNQINKLTIEIQNIPNVTEQEYENAKEKFIEFPIDVLSHLPDNFLFNISEEFFSQLPKDFISAFSEEDLSKIPINVRIRAGMKCVKFGKYEWYVISLSSINATLLCKDIVCQKAYNDKLEEITWENCTLRSWLNNDFYNEFNDTEKVKIVKTRCKNNNENDTEDYIFIYTLERAESIDKSIRCCNTW